MKTTDIKVSHIWIFNDEHLVVADSIDKAIEMFRTYYDSQSIEKVELFNGDINTNYCIVEKHHVD